MSKPQSQRRASRSRIGVAILVVGLSLYLFLDEAEEAEGREPTHVTTEAAVLEAPPPSPDVSDPTAALERAAALREEGELSEARRLLEALADDAGEAVEPRVRYELGMTLLEQGELDLAEEHVEAALEAAPDDAEIVFGMAQVVGTQAASETNMLVQFSLGTKSKKLLDRAVELDGTLVDARLGRMLFYILAPSLIGGGMERARAEAEAIAEVDEVAGLFARGWIAEQDEEFERAEELHERSIELDTAYTPARFRLGYLLLGQERHAEARPHFEACREHEPRDPRSHQGLARCLLGEGDPDGAIELHRLALELAEDFSPSVFGLAECFDAKGEEERAGEHYRRYLELRDDGESADEARAWLAAHD
jgi:tetratricopeptide (TPR) repeat protein